MASSTTVSPWADLIDPDHIPHLPDALQATTAVLLEVFKACDAIAIHNRFLFLDYPQTAEELARNVPGLSTNAAAALLFHLNDAVEQGCFTDDAEAIENGVHDAIDVLSSGSMPDLPDGAIDPRTIPAGLEPRPSTYWDAVSCDDSPQVGWPKVTWEGDDYLTPQVEGLRDLSEFRPDGEFVGMGHPDSWGMLLGLLPPDPEAMS